VGEFSGRVLTGQHNVNEDVYESCGVSTHHKRQDGQLILLAIAVFPDEGTNIVAVFTGLSLIDIEIISLFLSPCVSLEWMCKFLHVAIECQLRCCSCPVQGSTILCCFASGLVLASILYLAVGAAVPDRFDFPSMIIGCMVAAVTN